MPPGFSICLHGLAPASSCLGYIYGDYTTKLYVDDNKPFMVSLKNNQ